MAVIVGTNRYDMSETVNAIVRFGSTDIITVRVTTDEGRSGATAAITPEYARRVAENLIEIADKIEAAVQEHFAAQATRQKEAYEARYGYTGEDFPIYDHLSFEDQAAICEKCGVILDPEMPIEEGHPVLCNGTTCKEEEH